MRTAHPKQQENFAWNIKNNDADYNNERLQQVNRELAQRREANPQGTKYQSVCRYYLAGTCQKGDQCKFLHEDNPDKLPLCPNIQKYGVCKDLPKCRYKHVGEDTQECYLYRLGFCPYGPQCKYTHTYIPGPPPSPRSLEAAKPQQKRKLRNVREQLQRLPEDLLARLIAYQQRAQANIQDFAAKEQAGALALRNQTDAPSQSHDWSIAVAHPNPSSQRMPALPPNAPANASHDNDSQALVPFNAEQSNISQPQKDGSYPAGQLPGPPSRSNDAPKHPHSKQHGKHGWHGQSRGGHDRKGRHSKRGGGRGGAVDYSGTMTASTWLQSQKRLMGGRNKGRGGKGGRQYDNRHRDNTGASNEQSPSVRDNKSNGQVDYHLSSHVEDLLQRLGVGGGGQSSDAQPQAQAQANQVSHTPMQSLNNTGIQRIPDASNAHQSIGSGQIVAQQGSEQIASMAPGIVGPNAGILVNENGQIVSSVPQYSSAQVDGGHVTSSQYGYVVQPQDNNVGQQHGAKGSAGDQSQGQLHRNRQNSNTTGGSYRGGRNSGFRRDRYNDNRDRDRRERRDRRGSNQRWGQQRNNQRRGGRSYDDWSDDGGSPSGKRKRDGTSDDEGNEQGGQRNRAGADHRYYGNDRRKYRGGGRRHQDRRQDDGGRYQQPRAGEQVVQGGSVGMLQPLQQQQVQTQPVQTLPQVVQPNVQFVGQQNEGSVVIMQQQAVVGPDGTLQLVLVPAQQAGVQNAGQAPGGMLLQQGVEQHIVLNGQQPQNVIIGQPQGQGF